MRTVQVGQYGGTEVLAVADLPVPMCGPEQILVKVLAAGVNFIDTYQRSGLYPLPTPFTLGREGSGEVVEVGANVSGIEVGALVAWPAVQGSYAEYVTMSAADCIVVPTDIDGNTACAAMLQGMTAHYLVTSVFDVKPKDVALVHAAAGGVGLLLCQLIAARGGTVIGTVSTEDKATAARLAGAHHIIRYDREDVAQSVREITNGNGVDVVYDGVGASTFEASLQSLTLRGLMVTFGNASGPIPPFELLRLSGLGSLSIIRPTLNDYIATHEEMQWRADELFAGVVGGTLNFAIGGTYPLSDAARAQDDLEGRRTSGKLLLIPEH